MYTLPSCALSVGWLLACCCSKVSSWLSALLRLFVLPSNTDSATCPSKACSQNLRLAVTLGNAAFTLSRNLPANPANSPYCGGTTVSILARSSLASTGALPALDTAMVIGLRSTMAGKIKVHSGGLSTTLTGIKRSSQS